MRNSNLDRLILGFDAGLRAVLGVVTSERKTPGEELEEVTLSTSERRQGAALMRVNHCGEVCAQALYQGQTLASGNAKVQAELRRAAREEADHLAWSVQRIGELGGRTSLLNPLWYAGSLGIGYVAGRFGDAWNLGFLAETEKQVERHLQGHLERLSPRDEKTRAVVEAMQKDEAEHAQTAQDLGGRELPRPVKAVMRSAAGVMTRLSYWV
jgi:ubiquinone biosynthesis monooxygenase Coq7